jgi:hypothetical protein
MKLVAASTGRTSLQLLVAAVAVDLRIALSSCLVAEVVTAIAVQIIRLYLVAIVVQRTQWMAIATVAVHRISRLMMVIVAINRIQEKSGAVTVIVQRVLLPWSATAVQTARVTIQTKCFVMAAVLVA